MKEVILFFIVPAILGGVLGNRLFDKYNDEEGNNETIEEVDI
ncbi:hypothetical protein [Clostridium baratii]